MFAEILLEPECDALPPPTLGRRLTDPIWREHMTEREIGNYLRAVEGRLVSLEVQVKNADISRADIKTSIAELRADLAQHRQRAEAWQNKIDVSHAGSAWVERLAWILLAAAITSGVWWLRP